MTDLVQAQPQQDWSSLPMSFYSPSCPPPGAGAVRQSHQYPSVKHRRRTSPSQLRVLEDEYKLNPKPDAVRRQSLATELQMRPREVQVWFQNRRAKERKQQKKRDSLSYSAEDAIDVAGPYGLGRRGSMPSLPIYDSPVHDMYRRRATVPHLPSAPDYMTDHLHNPAYTHLPDSTSSLVQNIHPQTPQAPIQHYSFPPQHPHQQHPHHPTHHPHPHESIFPPPTSFTSSEFSFWHDGSSSHPRPSSAALASLTDSSLYPSTSSNTPFSQNIPQNISSPHQAVTSGPQSITSSTPVPHLPQQQQQQQQQSSHQNIPQSVSPFPDNLVSSSFSV